MAETFDPADYAAFRAGASGSPTFDPAEFAESGAPKGYLDNLRRTFTEAVDRTKSGGAQLAQGVREWRADLADASARTQRGEAQPEGLPRHDPGEGYGAAPLDVIAGATNLALGPLGAITSPIDAAIDQYVGQNVEQYTGIPRGVTDFVAGLATARLPLPKRIPYPTVSRAEAAIPERKLGVTLSEGQSTGDLTQTQREQAALAGRSGPAPQRAAQAFTDQQRGELAAAREDLSRQMSPQGERVAETPQEAGDLVTQGVQREAAARKAGVDAAYREARNLPGEIHPDALTLMPEAIKSNLTSRAEPVIVEDALTPYAARMMKYLDEQVARLKIDNRADPLGPPKPTTETRTVVSGPGFHIAEDVEVPPKIMGVTLTGIDQIRRRLSTMRKDAYGGINGGDKRATSAVLDAFDAQIDHAINTGLFTGDERAIKAWSDARAANADYRSTFSGRSNDPVGRVIERIVGAAEKPELVPGNVADFLGGASSAGTSGPINVAVANRIKSILGERSSEWAAVKQGLLSRLIETAEGKKDFGPDRVAERLGEFLNGKGQKLAEAVYSPAERALMKEYADLMRKIAPPQRGVPWSNTPQFAAQSYRPGIATRVLNSIGSHLGNLVGALVGHAVMPGGGGVAGIAAAQAAGLSSQAREARYIAKKMPVIGNVVREFKIASDAVETTPTARNVARLTLAARNLSTNLKDIGMAVTQDDILRQLQGPVPARADQKQQQP